MAAIGAVGSYGFSSTYWYGYPQRTSAAAAVEPVDPVKPVTSSLAKGVEPVVMARIGASAEAASRPETAEEMLARYDSDPVGMAVRQRIQFPGSEQTVQLPGAEKLPGAAEDGQELKSAAEVMEEGECQTCASRKYQDGSDDPGVSFKTPAHIDPSNAAAVVRGHEQEHVVREQAKAEREDRKVIQQSVTLHSDICPECGKVFISGGTTRTTTAADNGEELAQQQQERQNMGNGIAPEAAA